MNVKVAIAALGLATCIAAAAGAQTQTTAAKPTFAPDGTVHVPSFDLPPSALASPESRSFAKMRATIGARSFLPERGDAAAARNDVEKQIAPLLQMMKARYPVDIVDQTIAGVPTRVITPKGAPVDPDRVLINLHGGAFMMCADGCALLESLPIASLGKFKVVSVNYREAPEATFPAASEDVAAVYKELLKTYKPQQIGIYGCSAGGALSAEMGAWLPAHGLPQAGALGVFGAGGTRFGAGDSAYLTAYIDGAFPPPPAPGAPVKPEPIRSYFQGADMSDPMVSPALHLDVLAKFPPTLLITGTRAPDMSSAIFTHSQLVKAGVPGDLIVGEGMGHCFIYTPMLPEAQDAYKTIVDFFRKNLG
jgi:acetyl esterase/lipase